MMPPSTIASLTTRGTQRHHTQFWGTRYTNRKARSAAISMECRTQYVDSCSQLMYERALEMARLKDYKKAQVAFQKCVQLDENFSKAWISWAQMEKRAPGDDNLERCRKVLQRGLVLNPTDARLLQAWGLMELQRGNILAAVLLLERCVRYEPRCSPVLRWKAVETAKRTVSNRMRRQLQPIPVVVSVRPPPSAWPGA